MSAEKRDGPTEGYTCAPDGVPIYFDVYSPGDDHGKPALVFVHGWSCDRTYWRCQTSYFAQEYPVVAVDLAGHGASGLARQAWTMQAFGADVAAVVEHLAIDQVILIGHSMGGPVIVEAAQRLPHQTVALIGVETFKNLDRTRTEVQIADSLKQFEGDFVTAARRFVREGQFRSTSGSALMAEIIEDMASAPPEIAIEAYAELQRHQAAARSGLAAIETPKVLINADYRRMNREAAERFGFRVEVMADVSHFLMREQPEKFNALVDTVLADLLA